MIEKILIAAPTASVKNYCVESWLLHLNTLKYPSFEVVLYDNTPGGGNAEFINNLIKTLPLNFIARCFQSEFRIAASIAERMAVSHNDCRLYAIGHGYNHWLHLETDVFPEDNVIEQLLSASKKVVGALYYRDEGKSRKLMIQRHIYRSPYNIFAENMLPGEDATFINGAVKKVAHVGLGCVLIHSDVFSLIKFRFEKSNLTSPDSFFMEDCLKNNIDIFADTSLICRHENSPEVWGSAMVKDKLLS